MGKCVRSERGSSRGRVNSHELSRSRPTQRGQASPNCPCSAQKH